VRSRWLDSEEEQAPLSAGWGWQADHHRASGRVGHPDISRTAPGTQPRPAAFTSACADSGPVVRTCVKAPHSRGEAARTCQCSAGDQPLGGGKRLADDRSSGGMQKRASGCRVGPSPRQRLLAAGTAWAGNAAAAACLGFKLPHKAALPCGHTLHGHCSLQHAQWDNHTAGPSHWCWHCRHPSHF